MNQQIQPLQVTISLIRGSMTWNLPSSMQFTPGDTIPITVTITNPTDQRRLYALPWAMVRNGIILSVGLVTIEDADDWWVDGGESKEFSFELSPETTDAYLNMSLLAGITFEEEEEEAVEEIIDSLTTYLYSTAAPTVQPLEVQALWVTQAISILVGIGLVAFFMADVLRRGTEVVRKL